MKPLQEPSAAAIAERAPKINYSGKLIVFTSFYDFRGHAPYIQSMVALAMVLERLNINWDFWATFGDFHIERAINDAYTRFLNDPEATDILCIDSDESFKPEGVLRLLGHQEEIVGGAYRMKNNWKDWTAIWMVNEQGIPRGKALGDGTGLLEAYRVPWGFLRMKRSALEKYRDGFPELRYRGRDGKEQIIFCQQQYRDGEFFSQDYVLSERMKKIGVQMWIDPAITIGHWGNTEYSGNLDEHLKALKANQDESAKIASALGFDDKEKQAFAVVQQMAREIEERKAA